MRADAAPPAPGRWGGFTDVAGLTVGHYTDPRRPTGCTVVLTPQGAVASVDVRGAAPGSRETELLSPLNSVQQVHALLLAGGSAFGLDAAGGVMRWLEEQGCGIAVGALRVPIVPSAILFDLWLGDASIRPDAAAGYAACCAASRAPPAEGNVGAGAGASVGKLFGIERAMRGGIGHAAWRVGGITIAALVVVNAVGDVIDAGGRVVAGARSADGGELLGSTAALLRGDIPALPPIGAATTLAIIATDAVLTKVQAGQLARMAHDGLARSIDPVHTPADGDTIFALATGSAGRTAEPGVIGAVACRVLACAALRAVEKATSLDLPSLPRLPSASDFRRAAAAPAGAAQRGGPAPGRQGPCD